MSITLNRWRLVLGKSAEQSLDFQQAEGEGEGEGQGMPSKYQQMEELLEYLYGREYGKERGIRVDQEREKKGEQDKAGGTGGSQLSVPKWITKVRKLFPKSTVEILERHALDKYQMRDLLTDKEVLEKMSPNMDLLKTVLQMKHLMKGEVLETARTIVAKVVGELREKLESQVRLSFFGKIDRNKASTVKSIRNLDFKRTVRQNLKNWDAKNNRLVVERMYFHGRVKRFTPWDFIISVDQSGSMLDSAIHSAIMAGIFASLPQLRLKLNVFDTNVVDLSDHLDDPVQTLMSFQLGGGTNIQKALAYCESLLETPQRSIVVMVTDLYEGGGYAQMYARASSIIESGAKLLLLTSLDADAEPFYDRQAAEKMRELGAEVGAMTPEHLAEWVGEIVGS